MQALKRVKNTVLIFVLHTNTIVNDLNPHQIWIVWGLLIGWRLERLRPVAEELEYARK